MDPRFGESPVLTMREKWTRDNIKELVRKIFEIVTENGWKLNSCEWITTRARQKIDLKHSAFSQLKICVTTAKGKPQEYLLQIPELIHDQFFYIGGYAKLPIFQLYDMPIIHRVGNKGEMLRFHNNVINAKIMRKNEDVNIIIFGKTVPLHSLIATLHTRDEWNAFRKVCPKKNPDMGEILSKLNDRCCEIWDRKLNTEAKCDLIGEFVMNNAADKNRKGEHFLFSVKVATKIDFWTHQFMKFPESIPFELLNALGEGYRSDRDLSNKRIRFEEYILTPLMSRVYEMVLAMHNRKDKFQISQSVILDNCLAASTKSRSNVAAIVHYNFPINPVDELASLLQCTLVGPGGFKKENVPPHIRNMDESHMGRLCPADTPDRDGCGVITNMVPTVNINPDGSFGDPDKNNVMSYPISLVPFMENDDPTRLQMASGQMKQTVLLKSAEKPWIRSGLEGNYLEHTSFMHVAKHDGVVAYIDESYMIVVYTGSESPTPEADVFRIRYRELCSSDIDFIDCLVSVGEEFKKGDILCQSRFIQDGEVAIGRNLLTAIMIWSGYNYEDGIVISEDIVGPMTSLHGLDMGYSVDTGQVLLSLVDEDYKPFAEKKQKFNRGEAYARIKNLDWEAGFENINDEPKEHLAAEDCTIVSINVFPNSWSKQIPQFELAMKDVIARQTSRYQLAKSALDSYGFDKYQISQILNKTRLHVLNCTPENVGSYVLKKEPYTGSHVEVSAIFEEKLGEGDKLANRHGNKGVVARVVPRDQMPILEDGRRPDIIINPLGIISRMNTGQLFELHLGECIYQLKTKMRSMKSSTEREKYLKGFLKILDNTPGHWTTKKVMAKYQAVELAEGKDIAIDEIYVIMPPFQSAKTDQIDAAMKYTGALYKMEVTDPNTGLGIVNPIACGYMYFNKLTHRATAKMSARSIGPYNRTTSQPMGGKANRGGHRLGEMEVWALLAHGSNEFLRDLLTTHSDSLGSKSKEIARILKNDTLAENTTDVKPQSLLVLEAYMSMMGVSIANDDGPVGDLHTQCKIEKENRENAKTENRTQS